jgi:hypothetical protein
MNYRSFRSVLLLSILISLVALPGILTARAAAPSKHAGRSFQPVGHGVVVPQRINTANLPQIHASQSTTTSIQQSVPGSGKRASVPYPSNVVSVPAPTSSDRSAKVGLSEKSGEGNPDATGAGGIDNYLETVSANLSIYGRGGSQLKTSTYQSWFGVNSIFYDPMTVWDDTGDRFIFSALQTGAKSIWISVAQQTSATGSYCNYSFPTLAYHDFDHLGVDSDGIYFGFNILAPGSKTQVVNNELYYASRTALENCQTATYTSWTDLTNPDGTIAEAITPAKQDNSTPGFEYLVNSIPAGGCSLTLWTLSSSGNLSNASIPTQCYSPPPAAPQKGSSALIYTGGDCSITQASLINGQLTVDTPGTYDWGDGNGPVGIVEWFVINPSTASLASQGAFGTPGYSLFYPSTIMTPNGHMLFVYNASGPTIYPSVWYVNQGLTNTTALANGTSYYGTSGVSVWGYYQSAWPDASTVNLNSVWITGEYANGTNTWGTKFGLLTP